MNIQLAILTKKYFSHKAGEVLKVLDMTREGLFTVQFEDDTIDELGLKRFEMING